MTETIISELILAGLKLYRDFASQSPNPEEVNARCDLLLREQLALAADPIAEEQAELDAKVPPK